MVQYLINFHEERRTVITAALATAIYGGVAVLHSSGVVIATGSAGYVAGTLGAVGLSVLFALPI